MVQRALAAGDLSTPRFIGAPSLDHPYRRVPPLEMTIAASSIHPFQKGTNGKNVSPHLSFGRKRSGAAKSRSPIAQRALATGDLSTPRFMGAPSLDHPYRRVPPLEMTIAAGSIHPFQKGTNGENVSPHLSFGRKRSGAVKSRSPIVQRALAAGNLSAPRFMGVPGLDRPYRRIPPLEMTIAAGSIHPFQKGTNGKNVSPHPSFGRKRSGAVESRSPIVQRALAAGNLSAPRFMSAPSLNHPYRRVLPLEMTQGLKLTVTSPE